MRSPVVSAAALVVCLFAAASPLQAQVSVPARVRAAADRGDRVRLIVGVRTGFRPEGRLTPGQRDVQRAAIRAGVSKVLDRAVGARRARPFASIPFFAAEVDRAALDRLAADPDVTSIEEDAPDRPLLLDSVPLVGAPDAWSAGFSGAGWAVAVLDTGVATGHPFFAGKVVAEACFSNSGTASAQRSLCPGGAPSSTAAGSGINCTGASGCDHGTHVAGIAVGKGTSMSGVARDASLIAIQVFTKFPAEECGITACLGAWQSDQISALEHVLALSATENIAAVNMSLGGGLFDDQSVCDALNSARKAAIDNLRSVGIATVIASGNSGAPNSLSAPACISSAISVGSTDKSDVVSPFSNGAPFLKLLAPGSSILSSIPNTTFGFNSGTSMAAPHVAGAWAVLKSRKPSASVDAALAALRDTGVPIADPRSGRTYPRIRVDRAANALRPPVMALETPAAGTTVSAPFTISGYAIDPAAISGTGVDAIHVYAFPAAGGSPIFLGASPYGLPRPDIGALYGAQFTASGFELPVASLAPGAYQLVAYAHVTASGSFEISSAAAITVRAPVSIPEIEIDAPSPGAILSSRFEVRGWAADLGSTNGSGVDAIHVYAFPEAGGSPVFLGVGEYGIARGDVGAAFGDAFTGSGYRLAATLAPGRYTVVVFARSTVTYQFSGRAVAVQVRYGDPLMSLDLPAAGTSAQPLVIGGWAIDRDAASGSGVDAIHVWALPSSGSPIFLGSAALGGPRPDVALVYGAQFAASGFALIAPSLPPGDYQVAAYVHSSVTGTFSLSRAVAVTVR